MSVNNVNFWTAKNYMKRDLSGSTSIAAPTTLYGTGGYYRTTFTVLHNLGTIPFFRVYYQPFKDGVIYPAQGNRIIGSIEKIDNSGSIGPICLANPTSSNLTIEVGFQNNTLTGTFPIYWVIYRDYGL